MIIRRPPDILASEITPERGYVGRRQFLRDAGLLATAAVTTPSLLAACARDATQDSGGDVALAEQGQDDKQNSLEEITSYNNFYEFGTDKEDPKANSGGFHPKPWSVRVDGLCKKPGDVAFEDLVK